MISRTRSERRDGGRETPEISQTSFLRSENSGAEIGFKFECIWIRLVLYSYVI